jgi:hypothetical protein
VATREREARLEELLAAGWTTDLFAQFSAAPDLKYIPSIITHDVVGYWPGGRTVRGKAESMRALEDLLTLLPRSPSRGARAHDERQQRVWLLTLGNERDRRARPLRDERDGPHESSRRLVCENYVFFDSSEFQQLVGA